MTTCSRTEPHCPWCRTCTLPGCFQLPLPPADGLLGQVGSNVQPCQPCCLMIVGTIGKHKNNQASLKIWSNLKLQARNFHFVQVGTNVLVLFRNRFDAAFCLLIIDFLGWDRFKETPDQSSCTGHQAKTYGTSSFYDSYLFNATKLKQNVELFSWKVVMILSAWSHLFGDQIRAERTGSTWLWSIRCGTWPATHHSGIRWTPERQSQVATSLAQPTDVALKVFFSHFTIQIMSLICIIMEFWILILMENTFCIQNMKYMSNLQHT